MVLLRVTVYVVYVRFDTRPYANVKDYFILKYITLLCSIIMDGLSINMKSIFVIIIYFLSIDGIEPKRFLRLSFFLTHPLIMLYTFLSNNHQIKTPFSSLPLIQSFFSSPTLFSSVWPRCIRQIHRIKFIFLSFIL